MDMAVTIEANPFTVIIDPFDTVPEIKMKIHKVTGIPISRQILIFQGHILTDDFNILDSSIVYKSRIQLIFNNDFPPPPAAQDYPARLYGLDKEFKITTEDLSCPTAAAEIDPPPPPLFTTTTGRNDLPPLPPILTYTPTAAAEINPPLPPLFTTTTGKNDLPPPPPLITTTTGKNDLPPLPPLFTTTTGKNDLPPLPPMIYTPTAAAEINIPPAPLFTTITGRNDLPPPPPLFTTTTGKNDLPPPPPTPTPSAAGGSNQNPAADSNPNSKRPKVSKGSSNEEPMIRVVVDFRGVRTPVEVMRDDTVASLKEKLEEMAVNVPQGPYFFVHGQNTMEEERSYRWHRVAQGDEILLFPGYVERR